VNWLVDTNVLLRIAQPSHAMYSDAARSLAIIARRGDHLRITPQNLIEFWAVATRPIANNGLGISPVEAAAELLKLKKLFEVLPDEPEILFQWEHLVVKHGVIGRQTHDARLVAVMLVHNLTHLLTFNDRNFKRFNEITVLNPQNFSEEETK
jgi:predicted nucleic acid-binding protein